MPLSASTVLRLGASGWVRAAGLGVPLLVVVALLFGVSLRLSVSVSPLSFVRLRFGVFWSWLHRRRSASSNPKYRHFRRFLAHPVKKGTGRLAALLLALRARAPRFLGARARPFAGDRAGRGV